VQAEGAALGVVGHGLDHGAEDVGVDLRPIEVADVEQVGAGDLAEARHIHAAGEEAAVHVGEAVGPGLDLGGLALGELGVHGAEDLGEHRVGVRGIARAHLREGGGEEALAVEDGGVFGKEAEDQARHEVIEVFAAGGGGPLGVVLEELYVEAVQAAGGLDIEGVFADLLYGGDTGEREEKAEVLVKVGVGAGERLAVGEVLGLEAAAVGGEDELGLLAGGGGALGQGGERGGDLALGADAEVEVVALKDAAGEVGLVGIAAAEAVQGGFFCCRRLRERRRGRWPRQKARRRGWKRPLRSQRRSCSI